MSKKVNGKRRYILNKNKKGFSLVELLCAVAIIAIITPVLIGGFTNAAKLNLRSRLQQRVDAAANSVYEGISSVNYEDLEQYLSETNLWTPLDKTGTDYEYYVEKDYDGLEDCKVRVAVQKYSSAYIVPDLNLIGENSKYLTLSDVIYVDDSFAEQRIEQEIKNNSSFKDLIAADIRNRHGLSEVKTNKILISCQDPFDVSKISKSTEITLDIDSSNNIVANYAVKYRYPAMVQNPNADSNKLNLKYTYSHNKNGKWEKIEGTMEVNQIIMTAKSGQVTLPAEMTDANVLETSQTVFVYYTPYSQNDWVDIKNNHSTPFEIYFIEQKNTDDAFLNFNNSFNYANRSEYDSVKWRRMMTRDDSSGTFYIYSNNTNICEKGLPNTIYQSEDFQENMYRIIVSVTYDSTIFTEISGNFKAGEELLVSDSE